MRLRLLLLALFLALVALAAFNIVHQSVPSLEPAKTPRLVGAFHVHSAASSSDYPTLPQLANAARDEKLDFLVVTDHDNQLPESVAEDGVDLLFHAEISTPFGHLIQLGPGPILPPKERGSLAILDRLRQQSTLPVAAHPSDPKQPWTGPIDRLAGFEITNFGSSIRRRGGPVLIGLFPSIIAHRLNRPLALSQIYDRDATALRRWDLETDPQVKGYCAADAHGALLDWSRQITSWLTVIDAPTKRDDVQRAELIEQALGRGRFFCVAGLYGHNPRFQFAGFVGETQVAWPGDTLVEDGLERLAAIGPRSSLFTPTVVLLRNGNEIARTNGGQLQYADPLPGTYRVEVRLPVPSLLFGSRTVPVIYSNRIRVSPSSVPPPPIDDQTHSPESLPPEDAPPGPNPQSLDTTPALPSGPKTP